jgi:hypothetical protein
MPLLDYKVDRSLINPSSEIDQGDWKVLRMLLSVCVCACACMCLFFCVFSVVGEDLDKLRKAIKPDFTALDTAKQLIAQVCTIEVFRTQSAVRTTSC